MPVAQHGLEIYGAGVITLRELLDDYMAREDPVGRMKELEAEKVAKPWIEGLFMQKMAARYGPYVVMGRNGELIGPQGRPSLAGSHSVTGPPSRGGVMDTSTGWIGAERENIGNNAIHRFNGDVDEVRLSNVIRY